MGDVIVDPDGRYGIDLEVVTPDGKHSYHEVEVRPDCWEGDRWKYPSVHVLDRKLHYLAKYGPANFWLWACHPDGRVAIIVPGTAIQEALDLAGKIVVPNKEVSDGEEFVDVSIEKCGYRRLE